MREMRALVFVTIAVAALVAVFWTRIAPPPSSELPRLTYVATAHQLGIVGYRDPAGVLSPDGARVAYSEGRFIRVVPAGGGLPQTLPPNDGQVRQLAWVGNDRLVAEESGGSPRWWLYQITPGGAERTALWAGRAEVGEAGPTASRVRVDDVRQLAWSADGQWAAGLAAGKEGPELWRVSVDGSRTEMRRLAGRPSAPTWTPSGEIACVTSESGRPRVSLPCGTTIIPFMPDVDVVGPIAFSPDGTRIYFASPNAQDTVDLWVADRATNRAHRVTGFSRDAYAPSVAAGGEMLFKTPSYRTFVADVAAGGGAARQLTTFQSETPSWHPSQPKVAFTFGTWRRLLDDAKYPDIAQEIGVLDLTGVLPAHRPSEVIAQSPSEDQAMAWSPNGRWIAFHSHREMSDDLWLRPAEGGAPDRRITFLGRGAEVGWPRWSPDGQSVLLDGARKSDGRSVIYVIGVDQNSGMVTSDIREVRADGFDAELTHAEWLPSGTTVVALAKEGPGRQAIVTIPAAGGRPSVVYRWASEHDFSGLAAAPDGRSVAFTAPASDGYFQIFRIPLVGGTPVQVTVGPSHKSQPAWSPDGARIAFTVWNYDAVFWMLR